MATFADWVNENVGSEDLRAKVTAVAVCLDDLKACSEEMLSHALNLDDWPLLARHRFLDAWRVLKAEGAAPAPAVAAPAPAAPPPEAAPALEKVLIGTRGARETLLQGRKVRAAKNSVLTSGAKQLKC